ncbi:hypothetical protein CF327_g2493 [Tilletia walkeri]|uniref:Oligomycin resistance ATP-dependent permease YOR1 n=1 Tax=Tilletia walkeri TaxID=117179 RepID=A0A8X7NCR0_9BASI|nr:hypothetical protein CF327_g2493 [Tilletia walkeri]KAE8270859.1 hypothetical protein A4X09_0g1496 [Tilletia walkeri]
MKNPIKAWWSPEPAPEAYGGGTTVPEHSASFASRLLFSWLTPMLAVGWTRPLQSEDLWELPQDRTAEIMGDRVEEAFYRRVRPSKRPAAVAAHYRSTVVETPLATSPAKDLDEKATPMREDDDAVSASSTAHSSDAAAQSPSTATPSEKHSGKAPQPQVRQKAPFETVHGYKIPFPLRSKKPVYSESLFGALHEVFFWRFWFAGLLRFVADGLLTTSPLVTRALLEYLGQAYAYSIAPPGTVPAPPSAGRGWGLAVGLWAMQQIASLLTNQYYIVAQTTGFSCRTSLVSLILRKALRLDSRARLEHSTGKITTMISADCTRLDMASGFAHIMWIGPCQIILAIGLLIHNLGVSALVGLGVLILGTPIQAVIVARMIKTRRAAVRLTDRRVRLMQEVFTGIRILVLFEWRNTPFAERIGNMRREELFFLRKLALLRAMTFSFVYFLPVLSAVLSFITYALLGNGLNPAIIFSSLQYFTIIRMPLVFTPLVASSCGDAYVALGRISQYMLSKELKGDYDEDNEENGVEMHGSFTWETVGGPPDANAGAGGPAGMKGPKGPPGAEGMSKKGDKAEKEKRAKISKEDKAAAKQKKQDEKEKKKKEKIKKKAAKARWTQRRRRAEAGEDVSSSEDEADDVEDTVRNGGGGNAKIGGTSLEAKDENVLVPAQGKPFSLHDINLAIPKGELVGIVGRIGSGKSSILSALAGEMRKQNGTVSFGGTVAYAAQHSWIQNLTFKQNVLFGQAEDEERYQRVIENCALEHDIELLPQGDQTEIGEQGVNLSGGQKARVSLARAAYYDADIVLLDDPLSSSDPLVGRHLMHKCIMGFMSGKTRLLVTHQLWALPLVDRIIVVDNGRIVEQGTYPDLLSRKGGVFSKLIEEHGVEENEEQKEDQKEDKEELKKPGKEAVKVVSGGAGLMTDEEREVGAVSFKVYWRYLSSAGSVWWAPLLLTIMTLIQVSQIGNNLLLRYWSEGSIPGWKQGQYMGLYAGFGVAQAVFVFCGSFGVSVAGFYASLTLYKRSLGGVLNSPISFHETTPTGRIVNRLSKDVDTLDMQLPSNLFQFGNQLWTVLGTVALVIYSYNWLGVMFPPLIIIYTIIQAYYRRTSREAKRLDSILRSRLYSSFGETLTGMATIRAFRAQTRFVRVNESNIDYNNRSYYLTIAVQRWLSVRMDFLGNILVLGIGLAAVGFRRTTSPAVLGVALTYTLQITQSLSQMVQQLAQVEQDFNVVERVLHYADLPPEGPKLLPNDPEEDKWPTEGAIEFRNVQLRYREGLPLVLKGVSFKIRPGERVGVVGRTGAGKSSLLVALWRLAPIAGGQILIDGQDISEIGFETLRRGICIVPQDSVIFDNTLRFNIDPTGRATDAEMNAALRQVGLLVDGTASAGTATPHEDEEKVKEEEVVPAGEFRQQARKFTLDMPCREDSFSAGQRQLISLARAIVKNTKVLALDEATSSADVESDATIQRWIAKHMDRTLLCIAHRLNTICFYDRVLVMDKGEVAEFDAPLDLFDRSDSIFRSMCNAAKITREDILTIRAAADRKGSIVQALLQTSAEERAAVDPE